MENSYFDTLMQFLKTPIDSGDEIFNRFAALPGAIVANGKEPLQRYVYLPGNKKKRVVLVAHIDTVWDKSYEKSFSEERDVAFKDGVFCSTNSNCGIGADDRAGCAMLWELRDCGHSILIVDGEEHGKHGARFLRTTNPKLYKELNKHCYMIELDWAATDSCLFNQVDNTNKFKKYIEKTAGFVDSKRKGGTDLQILCKHICGVNIGVGYYGYHTNKEILVLSEWENTFLKLKEFLEKPQIKFHSNFIKPYLRFVNKCIHKAISIFKGL